MAAKLRFGSARVRLWGREGYRYKPLNRKHKNPLINNYNKIQDIEEGISGAEDTIENIDTTVKENVKFEKTLIQNIQEIQDKMRRPNLRIIVTTPA